MATSDADLWHQVHAQREDGVPAMFLIRDVEPRPDQPQIFVIELPYPITELSKLPDAAGYRRLDTFQEQWVEPACQALGWTFVAWKSEDGSFFLYLYGNGDPNALLAKLAPFDQALGFFNDEDAEWSEYAAFKELVEQAENAPEGDDDDAEGHVHSAACGHDHGDDDDDSDSGSVQLSLPIAGAKAGRDAKTAARRNGKAAKPAVARGKAASAKTPPTRNMINTESKSSTAAAKAASKSPSKPGIVKAAATAIANAASKALEKVGLKSPAKAAARGAKPAAKAAKPVAKAAKPVAKAAKPVAKAAAKPAAKAVKPVAKAAAKPTKATAKPTKAAAKPAAPPKPAPKAGAKAKASVDHANAKLKLAASKHGVNPAAARKPAAKPPQKPAAKAQKKPARS